MAREIRDYPVQNVNLVLNAINVYLSNEGYEYIEYSGENVYKKGYGILSGPTFFKFSSNGRVLRMEVWLKMALFPGVYIGELGLTGALGCAVKKVLRKRVAAIENIIFANGGSNQFGGVAQNQGGYAPNYGGYTPQQYNTQPQNGYIVCSNCGKQLPIGTVFCTNCGQAQNSSNQNYGNNYGYNNAVR